MAYAVANPDELKLQNYIIYSIVFHAVVSVAVLSVSFFERQATRWAGVPGGDLGNATRVSLAPAAGIPMPKPPDITDSKAVDLTKGLFKEEPKPPEPKTDATKIPKFEKEKPLPPSHKSKVFESKTPIPENAVAYGQRGSPDLPTGYSPTPGGGGAPGVTMQGQGGADFATRYGWYIAAARRRVAPNWNLLFLDPSVRNSRTLHCVISFTILRDGSIKNLRIAQSSGNASWDNSGLRAIQSSVPFPPLPNDWAASDVAVLWDFPDIENQ
jgi:TonB family protein